MNNDEDHNGSDYYTWSTKQPQGIGCKTWNAPDNQELEDIQKCCKSDKNKSQEDTICYMCVFVCTLPQPPCIVLEAPRSHCKSQINFLCKVIQLIAISLILMSRSPALETI